MKSELIRPVSKWGNSAGVLLPKEWLGREVTVNLIDRTSDIKKEILEIIDNYLEDILGIYLVGSYARGEERKDSDIDVLIISNSTNKEISLGKYNISIICLKDVEKIIENSPLMIYPRLVEARVILNKSLLEKLKKKKIAKGAFNDYIKSTKRIIKIEQESLELDKEMGLAASPSSAYSIILRLRGVFLMKCILEKENYSKIKFKKWINNNCKGVNYEGVYQLYLAIKESRKSNLKVDVSNIECLLNLLKKEVKRYDK